MKYNLFLITFFITALSCVLFEHKAHASEPSRRLPRPPKLYAKDGSGLSSSATLRQLRSSGVNAPSECFAEQNVSKNGGQAGYKRSHVPLLDKKRIFENAEFDAHRERYNEKNKQFCIFMISSEENTRAEQNPKDSLTQQIIQDRVYREQCRRQRKARALLLDAEPKNILKSWGCPIQ